jgi:hypothetical protein
MYIYNYTSCVFLYKLCDNNMLLIVVKLITKLCLSHELVLNCMVSQISSTIFQKCFVILLSFALEMVERLIISLERRVGRESTVSAKRIVFSVDFLYLTLDK